MMFFLDCTTLLFHHLPAWMVKTKHDAEAAHNNLYLHTESCRESCHV